MPDPVDLSTYTDAELAALRDQVNTETTRRAQVASVPDQVQDLLAAYTIAGGDVTALAQAATQAATTLAAARDQAEAETPATPAAPQTPATDPDDPSTTVPAADPITDAVSSVTTTVGGLIGGLLGKG